MRQIVVGVRSLRWGRCLVPLAPRERWPRSPMPECCPWSRQGRWVPPLLLINKNIWKFYIRYLWRCLPCPCSPWSWTGDWGSGNSSCPPYLPAPPHWSSRDAVRVVSRNFLIWMRLIQGFILGGFNITDWRPWESVVPSGRNGEGRRIDPIGRELSKTT